MPFRVTGRQSLGNVTGETKSALRVTPLVPDWPSRHWWGQDAYPDQGFAGTRTRVPGLSVGPGSIGFDLTPHWQDEHGSTKYEPQ